MKKFLSLAVGIVFLTGMLVPVNAEAAGDESGKAQKSAKKGHKGGKKSKKGSGGASTTPPPK